MYSVALGAGLGAKQQQEVVKLRKSLFDAPGVCACASVHDRESERVMIESILSALHVRLTCVPYMCALYVDIHIDR